MEHVTDDLISQWDSSHVHLNVHITKMFSLA
jgi:hypothetical protein